jgi:hypothetical protein
MSFKNFYFSATEPKLAKHWTYLLLSLGIILLAILRFRFIEVPLERDEGEYAYMGQLILQGIPPYKLAYNMKLPGVYFMYALFIQIFGESIRGIHLGFLVINLSSIVLLYIIFKKFMNEIIAILCALTYGLYSTSPYVLGFAFHATHLVLFFFLLSFLFFLAHIENSKMIPLYLSGIFLGISFLMKQQGIFLVLFLFFYLFYFNFLNKQRFLSIFIKQFLFGLFILLPFLLSIFYLFSKGVISEFYFWTFSYASKYVSITSVSEGFQNLSNTVKILSYGYKFFWYLFPIGILFYLFSNDSTPQKVLLSSLVFFSFLTTVPGFYFREHYFISFLPFLLLFSFKAIEYVFQQIYFKIRKNLGILFLILFFIYSVRNSIYTFKSYYLKDNPNQISRSVYGANPFIESIYLSKYIKDNSKENDQIFVFGSEPEIYFYTNRKSTTGYIYMYPLMEPHPYSLEMQKKLVATALKSKPKFVVLVNPELNFSWGITDKTNPYLVNWLKDSFRKTSYTPVLRYEIIDLQKTNLVEKDLYLTEPKSKYYVELYELTSQD